MAACPFSNYLTYPIMPTPTLGARAPASPGSPHSQSPAAFLTRRCYTLSNGKFARHPLRIVGSKLRSAWGNFRQLIGVPSEIRRLRTALPELVRDGAVDQIKRLTRHTHQRGEAVLSARLKTLSAGLGARHQSRQWIAYLQMQLDADKEALNALPPLPCYYDALTEARSLLDEVVCFDRGETAPPISLPEVERARCTLRSIAQNPARWTGSDALLSDALTSTEELAAALRAGVPDLGPAQERTGAALRQFEVAVAREHWTLSARLDTGRRHDLRNAMNTKDDLMSGAIERLEWQDASIANTWNAIQHEG